MRPQTHIASFTLIVVAALFFRADMAHAGDGWEIGEVRKSGIGTYKKLVARADEWTIWETAYHGSVTCVAVLPSEGRSLPFISDGGGIVAVGAGFYFAKGEVLRTTRFGLFGAHTYVQSWAMEIDDKIVTDIPSIETVFGWEGKRVKFEINTKPYEHLNIDIENDVGSIHFSEVRKAYQAMENCLNS